MDAPLDGLEPFLDAAHRMGHRIAAEALWRGEECTWLLPSLEIWRLGYEEPPTPAAGALYRGTAGIGLFLAELHGTLPDRHLARAAEGALRHALRDAEEGPPNAFGFQSGRVGAAYAAARGAALLGRDDLLDAAARVLAPLRGREREDHLPDVLAGAAGAIPALLAIPEVPGAAAQALALGEHLLASARREPAGWSWGAPRPSSVRNLCGLAHGASGQGHALLELHRATGRADFRYAAGQAFAYERQFYSARAENWPDLRHLELSEHLFGADGGMDGLGELLAAGGDVPRYEPAFMCAWCHGAAGIGLARLHAWRVLGGDVLRAEAEAAVRTTRATLDGPQRSCCLCHGLAGNAETLAMAADVFARPALRREAEEAGWRAWEEFGGAGKRWPEPIPGVVPDVSLMMGEAGIGYFYLRLARPGTPSVLLPVGPGSTSTPTMGATDTGGAARVRLDYVRAYFGTTLDLFHALGAGPVPLPPPSERTPEIAAAHDAIAGRIESEPDAARRALLEDAFRVERARYLQALELTDYSVGFVEDLRREKVPPDWTAPFQAAPLATAVETERDWDAWLRTPPAGRSAEPAPGPAWYVVHRAGTRVQARRSTAFAARVLECAREPGTARDVARRVAAELDDQSIEPSALEARVRAQMEQGFRAGLLVQRPIGGQDDGITQGPHPSSN